MIETLDQPTGAKRITALEGLRGYAVFLVFLVHHDTLFGQYLRASSIAASISEFCRKIGNSGVDVFFVLSGFLIYGQLVERSPRVWSYCRARIRRIYPTFLAVFAAYLLTSYLMPSVSRLPAGASAQALYIIQNLLLLPGIFDITPLVTVTWSLSYEVFFYLSIPLLIHLTRMRQWQRVTRAWFFGCLILIHLIGFQYGLLPHIRLSMFLTGVLLHEVVQAKWMKGNLSAKGEAVVVTYYSTALLVVGMGGLYYIDNLRIVSTLLVSSTVFAVAAYCIQFPGLLQTVFNWVPLRRFGNMSYSYFLLHGLILNATALFMKSLGPQQLSAPEFACLLAVNLLMTILASFVLFSLIEKPLSVCPRAQSVPMGFRSTLPTTTVSTAQEGSRLKGMAAVVNQDAPLNGSCNPAPGGSTILIYGTGQEQVSPAVTDENAAPSSPLSNTVAVPTSKERHA